MYWSFSQGNQHLIPYTVDTFTAWLHCILGNLNLEEMWESRPKYPISRHTQNLSNYSRSTWSGVHNMSLTWIKHVIWGSHSIEKTWHKEHTIKSQTNIKLRKISIESYKASMMWPPWTDEVSKEKCIKRIMKNPSRLAIFFDGKRLGMFTNDAAGFFPQLANFIPWTFSKVFFLLFDSIFGWVL